MPPISVQPFRSYPTTHVAGYSLVRVASVMWLSRDSDTHKSCQRRDRSTLEERSRESRSSAETNDEDAGN
jgi:hypothetical protein